MPGSGTRSRTGGWLMAGLVLVFACATPEPSGEAGTSASPDGEPAPEPLVVPLDRKQPLAPAPEDEARWQLRIDQAERLHEQEDFEAALALARAGLAEDPPEPWAHRLRAIELAAKKKLLTHTYLDAFVRFRQERYVVGDVIEGDIVLMNISPHRVVIPSVRWVELPGQPEPAESKTVFRSVMSYREFVPTNTLVVNSDSDNVFVDQDIVLERGEAYRIPVAINTMEMNPAGQMLKTYTLECKLHAAEIRVGEEVFEMSLTFRPHVAAVYPRNAEHLADDPMARVRQALEKESPVHLTLAASMVAPADRDDLYRLLANELERPGVSERMANALMTCLAIVSGNEDNREKEDWIAWLKTRK